MERKTLIKYLFQKPSIVLRKGVYFYEELIHKQFLIDNFGISQLKTIDYLDFIGEVQNETVSSYSYLDGTSLISDLLLLKILAKRTENCKYLEIGTFRGESIINIAPYVSRAVSITLGKEQMKQMGLSDKFIEISGVFTRGLNNVDWFFENSLEFDFSKLNNKFNLIFVDGDHSYEAVKEDTKNAFRTLDKENGIIVWHDYGNTTEDVRHSVLRGIIEGAPEGTINDIYHVSNTLCAIYIKNYNGNKYNIDKPTMPNKTFNFSISVERFRP